MDNVLHESLLLYLQESVTSESGSIESISGTGAIPTANPLGVSPVLSSSVETFPKVITKTVENDGSEENQTSDSSINSNITVPEIMRNRAASTGNVLNHRRDSASKGNDDHNRTMLFQVRSVEDDKFFRSYCY